MNPQPLTPRSIDLFDSDHRLQILWSDESPQFFSYRDLRIACRCASCIHELTGERLLDPNTIPDTIGVRDYKLVGNYGLRIYWSDGHDTGIYTWEYLKSLLGAPDPNRATPDA